MTIQNRHLPLAALLFAASCVSPLEHFSSPLEHEAWIQTGKGTQTVSASSGWAFYGAEVEAEGKSGVLAPDGVPETGTDHTDLAPQYGGAMKYSRYVADDITLGIVLEMRNFEADPISPLSAELTADPFTTYHIILSSRYLLDPLGHENRWRPFVGLDLGYVPGVDFGKVDVAYPGGIPSERIPIDASSYWSLGAVAGGSYLLKDNLSLDMGAFYEWALTPGEATLTLPNLGDAQADIEVWPEGLILFFGLTWYF